MKTNYKKVISIVKEKYILKAADNQTIVYLKVIGNYYKYITKAEGRGKFKDSMDLTKSQFTFVNFQKIRMF